MNSRRLSGTNRNRYHAVSRAHERGLTFGSSEKIVSSSFYVYPGDSRIPSFQEILDLGNARIRKLLLSRGLSYFIPFESRFGHGGPDYKFIPSKAPDLFRWKGDHDYVILRAGRDAATRVNCWEIDSFWQENIEIRGRGEQAEKIVGLEAAIAVGCFWTFRAGVGLLAYGRFSYGILAASLAELTKGLIDTSDQPASPRLLTPEEFYEWYFSPTGADWMPILLKEIAELPSP